MKNISELVARVVLGGFFAMAGFNKIGAGYAGTAGYMDAMGVPGSLLPLVIALEIIGGLMIVIGFKVNWAAIGLAGFTVVAAVIFHSNFGDQMQSIMFMKNIAIAAGLIILATNGASQFSLDNKMKG